MGVICPLLLTVFSACSIRLDCQQALSEEGFCCSDPGSFSSPEVAKLLHHPLGWLAFLGSLPSLFFFSFLFHFFFSLCYYIPVCLQQPDCFPRLALGQRVWLQRVMSSAVFPKEFPIILDILLQRGFKHRQAFSVDFFFSPRHPVTCGHTGWGVFFFLSWRSRKS